MPEIKNVIHRQRETLTLKRTTKHNPQLTHLKLLCTVAVSDIYKKLKFYGYLLLQVRHSSLRGITAFDADSHACLEGITSSNANDLNADSRTEMENGTKITNDKISTNHDNVNVSWNRKESNPKIDNKSETVAISQVNDSIAIPTKASTNTVKNKSSNNRKDIYMVAEGYHKTDSCYYKTPDGGYHKLPPDSYHKMSEICYNKLPDGSFKRLVEIQNAISGEAGISGSSEATNGVGSQNKVRNHMIRFLKRSKSHSQATAKETYINYRKEIQRAKDNEKYKDNQYESIIKNSNVTNIALQNSSQPGQNTAGNKSAASSNHNSNPRHSNHAGNRKVVVTMMENGGLPIVATSKTKSSKSEYKSHHQSSIRDKVKLFAFDNSFPISHITHVIQLI